jgi:hypothetical protein
VYYAAGGSGDPYHLSLNALTTFLDDCAIADSDSQYCKRSDCDTIFIVCNFQVRVCVYGHALTRPPGRVHAVVRLESFSRAARHSLDG